MNVLRCVNDNGESSNAVRDRSLSLRGANFESGDLALGLTRQGIASKLKVSRNTVARWERDEMAIPRLPCLKNLECGPRKRKSADKAA